MRWIEPDWSLPRGVRAAFSLRADGHSRGPYASLNLGDHVGDEPAAVAANREALRRALDLPAEPFWLRQVHGARVLRAGSGGERPEADAAIAGSGGEVLAILVADCLPILLVDAHGGAIGAVHAGWRGLLAGVVERSVGALLAAGAVPPLQAWLGPCIGQSRFEVGPELRAQFVAAAPDDAAAFVAGQGDRWQADLRALARRRLQALAVNRIQSADACTASRPAEFFSFRRDGVCGRMAALIWTSP